jgi:MFS family permease
MMAMAPRTAVQEWRSHWTLVMAGLVGFSLSAIASISLGTFTQPLEKEFGWSRADVTSGLLAYAVTRLILSPIFGNLIDRFGPRRVGLPGVFMVGVGFALFGTATGSLSNWLLLWIVFAILSQPAKITIWTASVSSEFHASRGLALAVTLAGSGLGNSFAQLYSYYLIEEFGWRLAYVVMGLSWGGVVFLICYFFLWARTDRLRVTGTKGAPPPVLSGVTIREGLRSASFFKLAGAAFFGNLLLCALMMQLVPVLTATGLSRVDAVWIGSLAGLATIAGKLLCGVLVDHMPGKYIAAAIVALPIITCAVLLTPDDSAIARLIPMAALGLSVGGQVHMMPYLATRYFGLRSFGTLYGFIGSVTAMAVGLGPYFSSKVFDLTSSYDLVLIAGIPLSIAATLLMLSLGRYPDAPAPAERPGPLGAPEPAAAG